MKNAVLRFLRDEEGQDIVEYSLLLVLIAGAVLFVLTTMGVSIKSVFEKINSRLSIVEQQAGSQP